jgi:hypothetical protein
MKKGNIFVYIFISVLIGCGSTPTMNSKVANDIKLNRNSLNPLKMEGLPFRISDYNIMGPEITIDMKDPYRYYDCFVFLNSYIGQDIKQYPLPSNGITIKDWLQANINLFSGLEFKEIPRLFMREVVDNSDSIGHIGRPIFDHIYFEIVDGCIAERVKKVVDYEKRIPLTITYITTDGNYFRFSFAGLYKGNSDNDNDKFKDELKNMKFR